jgi:hypothetical protein
VQSVDGANFASSFRVCTCCAVLGLLGSILKIVTDWSHYSSGAIVGLEKVLEVDRESQ